VKNLSPARTRSRDAGSWRGGRRPAPLARPPPCSRHTARAGGIGADCRQCTRCSTPVAAAAAPRGPPPRHGCAGSHRRGFRQDAGQVDHNPGAVTARRTVARSPARRTAATTCPTAPQSSGTARLPGRAPPRAPRTLVRQPAHHIAADDPDPPNTVATLRVAIAPPSCRCIVKRVFVTRAPGGYGESAQSNRRT